MFPITVLVEFGCYCLFIKWFGGTRMSYVMNT